MQGDLPPASGGPVFCRASISRRSFVRWRSDSVTKSRIRAANGAFHNEVSPPGRSTSSRDERIELPANGRSRYRTRIHKYGLAYRMQSSVAGNTDLTKSRKPRPISYGDAAKKSVSFATLHPLAAGSPAGLNAACVFDASLSQQWTTLQRRGPLPWSNSRLRSTCAVLIRDLKDKGMLTHAGGLGRAIRRRS